MKRIWLAMIYPLIFVFIITLISSSALILYTFLNNDNLHIIKDCKLKNLYIPVLNVGYLFRYECIYNITNNKQIFIKECINNTTLNCNFNYKDNNVMYNLLQVSIFNMNTSILGIILIYISLVVAFFILVVIPKENRNRNKIY
jgi:hypothetical protein